MGTILKCFWKKIVKWINLAQDREHGNETFGFRKRQRISWLAERQLDSQERLWSVQLWTDKLPLWRLPKASVGVSVGVFKDTRAVHSPAPSYNIASAGPLKFSLTAGHSLTCYGGASFIILLYRVASYTGRFGSYLHLSHYSSSFITS